MPPLTKAPQTPVACRRPRGVGKACTIRPRLLASRAALDAPWATRVRVKSQVEDVSAESAVVMPSAKVPARKIRRRP